MVFFLKNNILLNENVRCYLEAAHKKWRMRPTTTGLVVKKTNREMASAEVELGHSGHWMCCYCYSRAESSTDRQLDTVRWMKRMRMQRQPKLKPLSTSLVPIPATILAYWLRCLPCCCCCCGRFSSRGAKRFHN